MKTPNIAQAMSYNPIRVKMDENLMNAYDIIKNKKIRHLPVTDDNGKVVGIISQHDFQKILYSDFKLGTTVGEHMSWPVKTVSSNSDLVTVINMMIDKKISAVLVMENNTELVGIITQEDLLKVLRDLLNKSSYNEKFFNHIAGTPIRELAMMISDMGI